MSYYTVQLVNIFVLATVYGQSAFLRRLLLLLSTNTVELSTKLKHQHYRHHWEK